MIKKLQVPASFLIIVAAIFWYFYAAMPQVSESSPENVTEFSTARAFQHVKALAQQPHFVGTSAHAVAQDYIVKELEKLGLETQIQEGYSLSERGVLTRPANILARIEGSGTGKALLLLTHYDSAVHSSPGASDAASGVGTILEGVRAFLASGEVPVNDILLVFTDAEELGLNGAQLFVNEHPWAEETGLALNFEARGSGGSSFMLLETNHGNKSLIEHFVAADPEFPTTNSLAYSVYKMLPNDTDLTVLREDGGINGFNFAFIDDHFDYHTANDAPENLDLETLAHQGSYLMPLLEYFSRVPLEDLNSPEDVIYFDIPVFHMLSYPFSWIWPMLIIAAVFFIGLIVYGIGQKRMNPVSVLKGFLPLLLSLAVAGLGTYLLWELCLYLYPQYLEMEHGFTYNGYYYLAGIVFFSMGICFITYQYFRSKKQFGEFFIAPLLLWLLICGLAAAYLPGAAYFVIPVFFGLLQLFVLIRQKRPNLLLMSLLSLPAIFILLPFIQSFPVALGLKILFVSSILLVFLWTFLWPVFRSYRNLRSLGLLSLLSFFALFLIAHFKSDFTSKRPKPNSLVYLLDSDTQTATWNTYDAMGDEWTDKFFGEPYVSGEAADAFSSKYNSGFTKRAKAPVVPLRAPEVLVESTDSLGQQWHEVKIIPQRNINRIEVFTEGPFDFTEFTANGLTAQPVSTGENPPHIFKSRWTDRLLTYYAVDRDTLELKFRVEGDTLPVFTLYEASNDLLENDHLNVPPRPENMIPRPFVLNDAVVVKKSFTLE